MLEAGMHARIWTVHLSFHKMSTENHEKVSEWILEIGEDAVRVKWDKCIQECSFDVV